jgi:transcription termination/antitermination protein NusG
MSKLSAGNGGSPSGKFMAQMQRFPKAALDALDGQWVAVQVRVRCESVVAKQLALRGYESYAPVHARWPVSRRQPEALFPGYVFCRYRTTYHFKIVESPSVIRIVNIRGVPQIVAEKEVEAVRSILRLGLEPEHWDSITTNTRVRVCAGPLEGTEGTFVEVRNGGRLLIGITAIQSYIAVEVGPADVMPLLSSEAYEPRR